MKILSFTKTSSIFIGMFVLAAAAQVQAQDKNAEKLTYGKYGCTSSSGSVVSGTYSTQPRGSYVIKANGKYTYYGYEKPSSGTFTVDDKGVLHFKDGAFNGGEATPLGEGYPNQLFLVYPAIPGNRWKCKLVE
jgi:hypothetical protein